MLGMAMAMECTVQRTNKNNNFIIYSKTDEGTMKSVHCAASGKSAQSPWVIPIANDREMNGIKFEFVRTFRAHFK